MDENTTQKKGLGTGAKIGIGCGSGCLVLIVIMVIAGFLGWQWLDKTVKVFEADFADKGMIAGSVGQVINVTKVPTVPTFYKGQVVTLNFTEPVTVEIGVIAQTVDIVQGQFQKNVYFRGQVVTVNPTVQIAGELNVECQLVQDRGAKIKGGITGKYSAKQ